MDFFFYIYVKIYSKTLQAREYINLILQCKDTLQSYSTHDLQFGCGFRKGYIENQFVA